MLTDGRMIFTAVYFIQAISGILLIVCHVFSIRLARWLGLLTVNQIFFGRLFVIISNILIAVVNGVLSLILLAFWENVSGSLIYFFIGAALAFAVALRYRFYGPICLAK